MTSPAVPELSAAPGRTEIDASCRVAVLTWFVSGVGWLLAGTLLALVASIKLHSPYFLTGSGAWNDWLTFGRVRPAHLNTMIYGWSSMAGIATLLWLQARLCRVRLPAGPLLIAAAVWWNLVILGGTLAILAGEQSGVEWLEFPPIVILALAPVLLLLAAVSIWTVVRRQVEHLYVSTWYNLAAAVWFPILYVAAAGLIFAGGATGVAKATANWWFAHNILGLWLTPIGIGAIYYLVPKVVGRPIYSYYLSLLGFWTLALFYNWAGTHHLIGGPLPAWVITVGTVGSVLMLVPVGTVAINGIFTIKGHLGMLLTSPVLRFSAFAGVAYTLVSVQGAATAFRTVNETSHFTHYTVAHAHLGVYAFFTMTMFAVAYYALPRLLGREWASAKLIKLHWWTTALGVTLYWVALTIGGWRQGQMLNTAEIPFLDIVRYTIPWLQSRSVAGVLMTIGHLAFAWLVLLMLLGRGRPRKETA